MGERTAFFYGTLMAKEVLYRVIYGTSNLATRPEFAPLAANVSIRDALLHNYCRHHVAHADYPGMIAEAGKSVRGTYVTGLTDGDIWRLDCFEGSEYERKVVKCVLLGEGGEEIGEVEAETYVYVAGEDRLEKGEWSFEFFRKEKLKNWADGEEYEDVDAAVLAESEGGHDPTGGRAAVKGSVIKRLESENIENSVEEKLDSAV